jgi:hypothetical protein
MLRTKFFAIEGEQAAEEDKFVASGLSRREAIRLARKKLGGGFPTETDVVELAALSSIDPSRLEDQDHPLGLLTGAKSASNGTAALMLASPLRPISRKMIPTLSNYRRALRHTPP